VAVVLLLHTMVSGAQEAQPVLVHIFQPQAEQAQTAISTMQAGTAESDPGGKQISKVVPEPVMPMAAITVKEPMVAVHILAAPAEKLEAITVTISVQARDQVPAAELVK
jgi:hypothetical protein